MLQGEPVAPDVLCKHLLVMYQALLRFGFQDTDITVSYKVTHPGTGEDGWGVVLRTRGLEWAAHVGTTTETPEQFLLIWRAFAEDFLSNRPPPDELETLWTEFMSAEKFHSMICSIEDIGIVVPILSETQKSLN